MTTKQAIEQAMKGKRKPMTVTEIAEAAIPLSNLKGATPKQVIYWSSTPRTTAPTGSSLRATGNVQARPEEAEGVSDLVGLATSKATAATFGLLPTSSPRRLMRPHWGRRSESLWSSARSTSPLWTTARKARSLFARALARSGSRFMIPERWVAYEALRAPPCQWRGGSTTERVGSSHTHTRVTSGSSRRSSRVTTPPSVRSTDICQLHRTARVACVRRPIPTASSRAACGLNVASAKDADIRYRSATGREPSANVPHVLSDETELDYETALLGLG